MAERVKPTRVQMARDVIIFLIGLAGLVDQAFFVRPIAPIPMAIFAALVGYPGVAGGFSVNVFLPGAKKEMG